MEHTPMARRGASPATTATRLPSSLALSLMLCRSVVGVREERRQGDLDFQGWWPLESAVAEGIVYAGSTCRFADGGWFGEEGGCELTVLPAAQLAYLRDKLKPANASLLLRTDGEMMESTFHERYGLCLMLSDPSMLTGPILLRPGGDDADAQVRAAGWQAMRMVPEGLARPTVEVDFGAPCYSWRAPDRSETQGGSNFVRVHWSPMAHHVAIAVTQRSESVKESFDVKSMMEFLLNEGQLGALPEKLVADLPPPSCYIDSGASPDCALFEPHVSELRLLLECLGLPLDDGDTDLRRASHFLRLVFYGLRAPTSPRNLVRLAIRSLWQVWRWFPASHPQAMPGTVAKCLGLHTPDAPVSLPIAAVGCYPPMASVTGFGMSYSGVMDETVFDRLAHAQASTLLAGGFREATKFEEGVFMFNNHPLLVWPDLPVPVLHSLPRPARAIAEFRAPSICARAVADRLRRMSFMKYDKYAWFGDNANPIESLMPVGSGAVESCIAGRNPGYLYTGGSNCRYYVGCFMKLMRNFNLIPGMSRELVGLCTGPGRQMAELDVDWMGVDNKFWMSSTGATSLDVARGVWYAVSGEEKAEPPPQLGGFRAGDVVRLDRPPSTEPDGTLYVVGSVGPPHAEGRLCLRRGSSDSECYPPEAMRHVARDDWRLENGVPIPVPA